MNGYKMPPIGTLRDRVELFSNNPNIGSSGGLTDNFVSLGTVWAQVKASAGKLISIVDGRNSTTSHAIVMRYRTDLKPGDRLTYRGQNLEILSADDLNGRRAYLNCACTEINSTG